MYSLEPEKADRSSCKLHCTASSHKRCVHIVQIDEGELEVPEA